MKKTVITIIFFLALFASGLRSGIAGGSEYYTVIQGDFSTTVTPISNAESAKDFYSYSQRFGSSSDTGYEKSSTSLLFLYRDTISNELSLFMIHDRPLDSGGGTASFNFLGMPDYAGWLEKDDRVHVPYDNYYHDYVTWTWGACCTDGGVRGDIDGFREITIEPNYWSGINAWTFLSGNLNNPTYINLPSLNEPVIIRVWTKIPIDIKPWSDPNAINIQNRGVIPVAILTNDDFDAATVDPETVRFGPSEAYPVHYALEYVDDDDDIDMILHFRTQETGITVGDMEAVLRGATFAGMQIQGSDSVRVIDNDAGKKGAEETCTIPQDGLVSWWPGDGDANDYAGQNDGTLMNGTTFAPGVVGQAFSLDGLDDYVKIAMGPDLKGYTQLTLAAWVNSSPTSGSGCARIVEIGNDYNDSTALVLDTDCGGNYIGDARAWIHSNGARNGAIDTVGFGNYNDGQWHFLAFTWDGVNTRLYVDGVLMKTGTATGTIDSPARMLIGQHNFASPDNSNAFGGLIDEITVHDRALAGEEIQKIYESAGNCKNKASKKNSGKK